MGHENEGLLALNLPLTQHIQHVVTCMGIEVARRLVGQQHIWMVDERAGDGDPLLLAPREVAWWMVHAIRKPDTS